MIKIIKYQELNKDEVFARNETVSGVTDIVTGIIENVKANGDKALYEYAEKFDKVKLNSLVVSEEEINEVVQSVDKEFIDVLKESADNIRDFHSLQKRDGFELKKDRGVIVGQKINPVKKAGLYVPGGTAAYPSTVLMDAIPAKIAGVEEVCITTPPNKEGKINPYILAAAHVAGVDKIYKVGGAQAIAALAYGTETIPAVDKIVGPGNAFVAEAKRQVYGKVSIDMIAGPSEILVLSDNKSNPAYIAADLLSQAEHDKMASAVLVTDDISFASSVSEEIEKQLSVLPREAIARESIDNNGKIIVAENLMQAVEIANEIAPEHIEISVDNPFDYLEKINNAGSVFLGRNCPEAIGDYFAGPNHTLPTSGTAKFSSALSVDDFIKKTQYIYYTKEALDYAAPKVSYFAKLEGLDAHARSAIIRTEGSNE